jgi:SAM-dependent methyltransferase
VSDERHLRTTFDSAAAAYQSARPDYPSALFDDLIALTGISPDDTLLEIGCGPGKATLPLARKGFRITAIELGSDLAEQARLNLAPFRGVLVVTAPFEDWEPAVGGGFDLIYAATSWHWVDPEIGYPKAAALLRPGGHLAVWSAGHAFPDDVDPIFSAIQAVYDEIGEHHPGDWPPPPPDREADSSAELAASGRFEPVGVRRYLWFERYSADAYIALLNTFSGHIVMEPAKRNRLYAEIRRLLAARSDGQLIRHWSSVLTVGRRT